MWRYIIYIVLLIGLTNRTDAQKLSLPNLHINDFAQDKDGIMWIATARGLCRYNGYEYSLINGSSDSYLKLPADFIYDILIDDAGKLWISTYEGLCLYDRESNPLIQPITYEELYQLEESDKYIIGRNNEHLIAVDKNTTKVVFKSTLDECTTSGMFIADDSTIWSISSDGTFLSTYGPDFKVKSRIKMDCSIELLSTLNLKDGTILLGHSKGMTVLDPSLGRIEKCADPTGMLHKLPITAMVYLTDAKILLGTMNEGLWEYDLWSSQLSRSKINVSSQHITSLLTDHESNIWVGTFDSGYMIEYAHNANFNNDLVLHKLTNGKFVTSIIEDQNKNIWIGTRNYGLLCYNLETKQSQVYNIDNFPPFANINSNFIQSLYCDSNNTLWISLYRTLFCCKIDNGKLSVIKQDNNSSGVVCMSEDSRQRLWCGTEKDGLIIYDGPKITYAIHNANITNIIKGSDNDMIFSVFGQGVFTCNQDRLIPNMIANNVDVVSHASKSIFLLRDGQNLWIGTYGHGMIRYDMSSGTCEHFTVMNSGLPCNDVLSIDIAEDNCLWMSTSFGLTKYNPADNHFQNFYSHDGIGGNQFHEKCKLSASNGVIYFGGNHGITQVNSSKSIATSRDVKVILEDLKIFNKSITPDPQSQLLPMSIDKIDKIKLSHDQNVFCIDFTGINYKSSLHTNYAYRLKGFDADWNYVGEYRRASYSNLPSGDYVFEVKAQNTDGYWSSKITTLPIKIQRPPWLSFYAIMIYFIVAAICIWISLRIYGRFQREKRMLWIAENERDKEKQISQLKANFFANISHELRTPISMIYGPLNMLMSNKTPASDKPGLLNLIKYNTQRLLSLLDQLLDVNKIENETIKVTCELEDCVTICNNIIQSFAFIAQERAISLAFDSQYDSLTMMIDADKFTKILTNLVSNALKYTHKGGSVTIRIEVTDRPTEDFKNILSKTLIVSVIDDGVGIAAEEISAIFERNKRLDSELTDETTGFGIGLNYVKSLLEILNGEIMVKPNTPQGSVFKFCLPFYSSYSVIPGTHIYIDSEEPADSDKTYDKTILVVEDNYEIQQLIRMILKNEYTVYTASDGVEGYSKILDVIPDLIVCDVLMPGMNGIELCREVKNNSFVCHIPIIMLTACTSTENQIDGYRAGANIYINKPFCPELLLTVISNVFLDQTKKQQLILGEISLDDSGSNDGNDLKMTEYDKKFLKKLYSFIDDNISNTELSVDILSVELGFSRSSFYRKMNALTGQTPISFLRLYRLNRAKQLLETNEYSIREVSDMIGFVSASHFSSCFKKQYGISPGDIKTTL